MQTKKTPSGLTLRLALVAALLFFLPRIQKLDDLLLHLFGRVTAGKILPQGLVFDGHGVRKDYISVKIMLGGIASTFLIGYVVSLFVPVNFAWISIGLVGAASIYLFYLSIRNWVWHYALIALFALGSICFLFSVDYVFNDILEPHQQIRIKVSLGLEDDPSGAGDNVNQSKIAIGSGGLL